MKDRVPKYPGRVIITPTGKANEYDIVRADEAAEAGTPLCKETLLPDSLCDALGIDREGATPADALAACDAFWDNYRITRTFVPGNGESYDIGKGDLRNFLVGSKYFITQSPNTYASLDCFNVDTRQAFSVGNDNMDSLNGPVAFDGECLYVFGFASSGSKKLYKVVLTENSGTVAQIWSESSGYTTAFLYANEKYILGASGSGSATVWIWNKTGTLLGSAGYAYCSEDWFMDGDYFYTRNGGTVYKAMFDGFKFTQITSVAFPSGVSPYVGLRDYDKEKAFYGMDYATCKIYKITESMQVTAVIDLSPYVIPDTAVERSAAFCMSNNRYYYTAYGTVHVVDRETGKLLGKGAPQCDVGRYVASNAYGQEFRFQRGSSYGPVAVRLLEKDVPIITER